MTIFANTNTNRLNTLEMPHIGIERRKIEVLSERMFRKHVLLQYVKPGYAVLRTEIELVQKIVAEIMNEIHSLGEYGCSMNVLKNEVIQRANNNIGYIAATSDIDEDSLGHVIEDAKREIYFAIMGSAA